MPILLLAAAYILGAIPFGYLLVKLRTGRDVRSLGSGNIGATNVLRTSGRAIGIVTLVLDILKGYLAVFVMMRFTGGNPYWGSAAALAVMAGHAFPVFLKFHGGKAVASFIGAYLCLTPEPLLAVLILFLIIVWRTRFISFGSIIAAGLFPFAVFLILHPSWPIVVSALLAGGFVVVRHGSNIRRLAEGTENVLSFRRAR